jgi:phosphoribosyl 1,2-cyclic phosphate phosphodiesterase
MPREIATSNIRGEMILLGTGTSVGVPTIGCSCDVCQGGHPKNQRTRCAAILGLPEGNLLIDTPPDLRIQLLRERIGIVHAVVYTHEHADHIFGLDDLRLFPFYTGHPVPLLCEAAVAARIQKSFDYAFDELPPTHVGAAPQLEIRPISTAPFEVLGTTITPIRFEHGPRFQVLGFRAGNVAYCTDVSAVPEQSWPLLAGLDVLILGALRMRPHPTHLSLEEAVEVARRVQPKQTYFTHVSHELDYDRTNALLPPTMKLSYDGQRIPLTGLETSLALL